MPKLAQMKNDKVEGIIVSRVSSTNYDGMQTQPLAEEKWYCSMKKDFIINQGSLPRRQRSARHNSFCWNCYNGEFSRDTKAKSTLSIVCLTGFRKVTKTHFLGRLAIYGDGTIAICSEYSTLYIVQYIQYIYIQYILYAVNIVQE